MEMGYIFPASRFKSQRPSALLSPLLFSVTFFWTKKGESGFLLCCFYGFFLSKSMPTIAIAMRITITAAAMPMVRLDCDARPVTGEAVGAGVAGAGLATNADSA